MKKLLKLYIVIMLSILIVNENNIVYSIENKDPFFEDSTYIVVGDKVNVREKPKITSKIILQLKITDLVKLIRRSGIKYKSGNIEGEWVYIDTGKSKDIMRNETYKGWVIDYYLAKGNQFEEVKEFYDCILEGYVGDYHIYYEFKKDGSYKQKYYDSSKFEKEKNISKCFGKIYRYRNVIIVRDDCGLDYFYINGNKICYNEDNLCTELK